MNSHRHIVSICLAAVGLLLGGDAAAQNPPVCKKILTSVAQCDVTEELSDGSDCSLGGTPSWDDVIEYRKVLYTDIEGWTTGTGGYLDRLRFACRKYADAQANLDVLTNPAFAAYEPGDPVDVKMIVNTVDTKSGICLIDVDEDGVVEQDTVDDYTIDVWTDEVTPDPICFRTPNGPYKDEPGGGNTYGGSFSSDPDYRQRIYNRQSGQRLLSPRHPSYGLPVSDAAPWRDPSWANAFTPARPAGLDYFFALLPGGNFEDSVNFHHIIPRIDTKGCKCGKNSNANLFVTSRKLNGEMSNNWQGPAYSRIIQYGAP